MTKNVKILVVLGLILTILPPLLAFGITFLRTAVGFVTVAQSGVATPDGLAQMVVSNLIIMVIGLGGGALGILILAAAGITFVVTRPASTNSPVL